MQSQACRQREMQGIVLKACRLDVIAFKPGNVSILASGHDMVADDFLRSAKVAAAALCDTELAVGMRILEAIRATKEAVGCNTNLGIVLLLAPLVEAVYNTNTPQALRDQLRVVLADLSIADSETCYQAIRLAQPAGLGRADAEDVHVNPSQPLQQVMSLAADRDRVAAAYSSAYEEIFELALPIFAAGRERWGSLSWAVTYCYMELLARAPDSHIVRKFGLGLAEDVTKEVSSVTTDLKACENPRRFLGRLQALDQSLKQRGINPGTCADLTVATTMVWLALHRRPRD